MNIKVISILFAAALLTTTPAVAREKKEKAKTEQKAQSKKSRRSKKGQPQTSPQDSAKVEKPSVDREGLFHVTKEKNDWFFQIPDSLLGRQFLTTTRFTSTPAGSGKFGGEQVNEQTVYFQRGVDEQLLLRANLIINVADSTDNISRAITISNENPIIGSFKIESHKDGKYKIKVTQFFNQDNAAIALPQNAKKQYELQGMIPDMSYIEDIKSFPMNTEVRTVKTFATNGTALPSARYTGKVTFGLNISFVLLPEKPMMRRYYDPRVGFFTDRFTSYTDDQHYRT